MSDSKQTEADGQVMQYADADGPTVRVTCPGPGAYVLNGKLIIGWSRMVAALRVALAK